MRDIQAITVFYAEDMKQEDIMAIGACCFPTVMASVVLQGRADRAVRLLSKKLNLHDAADVTTSGKALLQSYLSIFTKGPLSVPPNVHNAINEQWFRTAVLDVLNRTPSICTRAFEVLNTGQ